MAEKGEKILLINSFQQSIDNLGHGDLLIFWTCFLFKTHRKLSIKFVIMIEKIYDYVFGHVNLYIGIIFLVIFIVYNISLSVISFWTKKTENQNGNYFCKE